MRYEDILSLFKGVCESGNGHTAHCPAHSDNNKSLSLSPGDKGILLNCFAGCEPENIVAAIGLQMSDLFYEPPKRNGAGYHASASLSRLASPSPAMEDIIPRKSITVASLAVDKGLPEDSIREVFKVRDSVNGVVIPYLNPDGSTFRERLRTELKAKDGSRWLAGTGQTAYGLHLLGVETHTDHAVFVEGESDTWTLHFHGFPALGIPGADGVKVVKPEHLEGLTRVYYVRELDKGGDTFAAKLPAHLRAIGFMGEVREVHMPDGVKDSNDLYKQNPDGFKAAFEVCLRDAMMVEDLPAPKPEAKTQTAKTICFADVAPEKISWFWFGKIALGKLTLLVGDPGLGKSLITLFMAARLSLGGNWPDGSPCPIGNTIFISCEDDPADTIRPRLDATSADVKKVYILTAVCNADGKEKTFTLENIPQLEEAIIRIGDVKMVVIDPISAYMGVADSHNNADVRSVLAPLSELAANHKTAIVAVSHLNKGSGPAMYRSMGSLAFTAAARAVWAVVKDKGDPDRRLVLPIKNNIAADTSGLAYKVITADNGAPCLEWEPTPVTDYDLHTAFNTAIITENKGSTGSPELDDAKAFLGGLLHEKPLPVSEIKKQASDAGFSLGTLRRAKNSIGILSVKDGFDGGWVWKLPAGGGTYVDYAAILDSKAEAVI